MILWPKFWNVWQSTISCNITCHDLFSIWFDIEAENTMVANLMQLVQSPRKKKAFTPPMWIETTCPILIAQYSTFGPPND
jgi:hypothetical protein